jgi:hypothetical protein
MAGARAQLASARSLEVALNGRSRVYLCSVVSVPKSRCVCAFVRCVNRERVRERAKDGIRENIFPFVSFLPPQKHSFWDLSCISVWFYLLL